MRAVSTRRTLAALVMSLASVTTACDDWVSVEGQVVTIDHRPMAAVDVRLRGGGLPDSGRTLVTNDAGQFDIFESVAPGDAEPLKFSLRVPGYKPLNAVLPNDAPSPARVILRLAPDSAAAPSTALMHLWSGRPGAQ